MRLKFWLAAVDTLFIIERAAHRLYLYAVERAGASVRYEDACNEVAPWD